eukprot:Skav216377  [mRNA]  locus=scaffold3826:24988:25290:+ [translate_table: standard]
MGLWSWTCPTVGGSADLKILRELFVKPRRSRAKGILATPGERKLSSAASAWVNRDATPVRHKRPAPGRSDAALKVWQVFSHHQRQPKRSDVPLFFCLVLS